MAWHGKKGEHGKVAGRQGTPANVGQTWFRYCKPNMTLPTSLEVHRLSASCCLRCITSCIPLPPPLTTPTLSHLDSEAGVTSEQLLCLRKDLQRQLARGAQHQRTHLALGLRRCQQLRDDSRRGGKGSMRRGCWRRKAQHGQGRQGNSRRVSSPFASPRLPHL